MPDCITTTTGGKTPHQDCCDPHEAAELGEMLTAVGDKYRAGIPLTTRELMRLAQCCLRLIGREGGQ